MAVDVVRYIYAEGEDARITIEQSNKVPGNIRVYTSSAKDKERYGDFDFDLDGDLIADLADALSKAVEEAFFRPQKSKRW